MKGAGGSGIKSHFVWRSQFSTAQPRQRPWYAFAMNKLNRWNIFLILLTSLQTMTLLTKDTFGVETKQLRMETPALSPELSV